MAWPAYDWMGVAKAALESTLPVPGPRPGAAGVRVNLVRPGRCGPMAANSIPGFDQFEGVWSGRAPLGWDMSDAEPAARGCVALLSDWFPRDDRRDRPRGRRRARDRGVTGLRAAAVRVDG